MQMLRAHAVVALLVGAVLLTSKSAEAQWYLTPLVTPPASVAGCVPVSPPAHARADVAQSTGHRFDIIGSRPGDERQITVFVKDGHPLLFNDYALRSTSLTSSSVTTIAARIDSVGAVHGVRMDHTTALPDSVLTMRHDREALARVAREGSKHTSTRAALTDAEKARVQEMAVWLLKRCP